MNADTATLLTLCVVATAAHIDRARPMCLEWILTKKPHSRQTAAEMLPTPLSPTGAAPATHWLCAMTLTEADAEHMQAFIVSRAVPVTAETAGQQEDGTVNKVANRDTWLATKGLKVVS